MLCIYFYTISNNFCERNVYNYITMVRWTWILLADLRDGTPNAPPIPHRQPPMRADAELPKQPGWRPCGKTSASPALGCTLKATRKAARSHLPVKVAGSERCNGFCFWKWETVRTVQPKSWRKLSLICSLDFDHLIPLMCCWVFLTCYRIRVLAISACFFVGSKHVNCRGTVASASCWTPATQGPHGRRWFHLPRKHRWYKAWMEPNPKMQQSGFLGGVSIHCSQGPRVNIFQAGHLQLHPMAQWVSQDTARNMPKSWTAHWVYTHLITRGSGFAKSGDSLIQEIQMQHRHRVPALKEQIYPISVHIGCHSFLGRREFFKVNQP